MTKSITTLPISHATAALFKQWVTELAAMFDSMGLTKTADTGQINISAIAAVPAVSTSGGYEIRFLNDAQNANMPLIFKFEYGTGTSLTAPQVWMTVGYTSDGAGNIPAGTTHIARVTCNTLGAPSSNVNNYPTLVCAIDGVSWGMFKKTSVGGSDIFSLAIHRNCDDNEVTTGDAATIAYTSGNSGTYTSISRNVGGYRYQAVPVAQLAGAIPTLFAGGAQPWRAYAFTPQVRPIKGYVYALNEFGTYQKVVLSPVKNNHVFMMMQFAGAQSIIPSGFSCGYIWE